MSGNIRTILRHRTRIIFLMVCSTVLESITSLIPSISFFIVLIDELITQVPVRLEVRKGQRPEILQARRAVLERKEGTRGRVWAE